MRKVLGAVVVLAMIVPAVAANGQSDLEYRDDFGSVTFSGSDGNLDWSGTPWIETGESDGPGAGQIFIGDQNCANNKCLHIEGQSQIALSRDATRAADLSNFATAQLSYEVHLAPALLAKGVLQVEVRGNGSSWKTVKNYSLALVEGRHTYSMNVLTYAGSDFQVRFRLIGLLGGDAVTVDRLSIIGEPIPPTTTSTSTSTTSTSTPKTSSSSSTSSTSSTSTTTAGTSTPNSQNGSDDGSPRTTATTVQGDAGIRNTTTTTTRDANSTSTLPVASGGPNPPQPPDPEIRQSGRLLMADYDPGMYNGGGVEVLAVSLDADYSLAVEVFGQIRLWLALLALLVVGVAVSGIEQKRRLTPRGHSSRRKGPVAG